MLKGYGRVGIMQDGTLDAAGDGQHEEVASHIHHCHLAPGQISCIFVKIYEPASAEEKKIRPEVAALKRTGSSKSRFSPYDKVLAWRVR